ncbi:MAG: exodeoxyribonuclease VII small subunit [Solirubrobacterales bacterium]|nr:exodeoxyribonuclease VII small subunit [Solirubrobacterales bacterium]
MSEEMTYESAVGRLDEIISRLDSGEAQLRETLDLCGEAKTLIEFCATELSAVDQGLKELKLDELAQSLAPATPGEAAPAPEAASGPQVTPPPEAAEEVPSVKDDEVPF